MVRALASIIGATGVLVFCQNASADFFINEFHYDNVSSDVGEFVEVIGNAGVDLSGASVVLYNGSATQRVPYKTLNLTTTLTDQCDGFGTELINLASGGMQNGSPDAIALVDATGNVMQFISYEGSFEAASGPAIGMTSVDIGVAETTSTPVGESLQLTGNGTVAADFSWTGPAVESPGACNAGQSFGAVVPPPVADHQITEIHYDNASSDVGEAIEIQAAANSNLDGWSISLYNGGNSDTYGNISLSGVIADQCDGQGTLSFTKSGLQNGAPDGVALVNPAGDVVEFLTYEGTITAVGGPAIGMTSTDLGVAETSSTPVGHSLQKLDGQWQAPAANTFGSCNGSIVVPPPAELALISEVQGAGDASPFVDQNVIVEAIVTADFQADTALKSFFVQEQDADQDADQLTSEGLVIFCGACDVDVAVGDLVKVTGKIVEFHNLTEMTALTAVEVISSGNSLPTATVVSDIAATDFEAIEGMLVAMTGPLTVVSNFNMQYGELGITDQGLLNQPTQVMAPGDAAQLQLEANNRAVLTLDDGSTVRNPDPIIYAADGGPLSAANTVRSGDVITDLSAVVSYGFGKYRLQPAAPVAISTANPRPVVAPSITGDLKVASINVLNFFTKLDQRGADTAEEFDRQRAKLLTALSALDADIIGLVEVENDLGDVADEAVVNIVDGLNTSGAAGTWTHVATGKIGTDQIKVAIIYRSDHVKTKGEFAVLNELVDPRFDTTKNRPALAQTFKVKGSKGRLTVIVNHFKSKGSACSTDPNQNDAQGNCNGVRTQAALALADWAAANPTGINEDNVLLLGDFNAYAKEDPIAALEASGFTNLETEFEDNSYSYTFNGQRGTLDYALATSCLAKQATGAVTWHINSDEPSILDYNLDSGRDAALFDSATPFRTSDHDPLLMGFNFDSRKFGKFLGPLQRGRSVSRWWFWAPLSFTLKHDESANNVKPIVTITHKKSGEVHELNIWGSHGYYRTWVPLYWLAKGKYVVEVDLGECGKTKKTRFKIR